MLEMVEHPPKFWGRYVDDERVITKKINVQALLDHINQQHESITFTIEEEGTDGTLPMLDVRMIKERENIIMDVCRTLLSVPSLLFHIC